MEHKIIGSIALGILFLSAVVGGLFLGRRWPLKLTLTAQKYKRILLVLVLLGLILTVGQYYLDNFMTDGKASIRETLIREMSPLAFFISVWIGAYIKQKSALMAEEKAAPTLK